jgi:hypothetical protein
VCDECEVGKDFIKVPGKIEICATAKRLPDTADIATLQKPLKFLAA